MARDIQIKVMVSVEEFVAFRALANEEGLSQSGMARQLIKHAIREYAAKSAAEDALAPTGTEGQD